ncbi:hypothetical protein [Mycobacterium sp. E740]|uniref:hypothetical protein n=1 Tax=Mycobacterium sp. E740 TaxID=1834149 RepID=UPI000800F245|nr:hypothetical protein [Mycobacterium sp. E740]OBI78036.1 hypothetical protein A5663_21255 [Mycobacterium sp. E740]
MRAFEFAVAVAAAALLSACASEGSNPPGEPQTTTSTGHGSLAHCLTEHGVPATPGPGGGPPPGVDPAAWHEAMQACASFAPGPAN